MIVKDKKSEVSSYFEKAEGQYLARSHTLNKAFKHIFAFVLVQMCAH